MVPLRTRRGIAVLAVLCLATFWLAGQQERPEAGPIAGLDPQLDYALSNFEMLAYDENGAPAVRIVAPRLASDARTGIGRIEAPRVEVNHEGKRWNMLARSAVVSDDQEIVLLQGAVTLTRRGDAPRDRLDVESEEVTLEVTPRIARSEQAVRVTDPAGTLTGRGFEVDMIEDRFRLFNDVEGVYVLQ